MERAGAVRDAQTNAVANIEGAVTQAVFYDDVPAIVGGGMSDTCLVA